MNRIRAAWKVLRGEWTASAPHSFVQTTSGTGNYTLTWFGEYGDALRRRSG